MEDTFRVGPLERVDIASSIVSSKMVSARKVNRSGTMGRAEGESQGFNVNFRRSRKASGREGTKSKFLRNINGRTRQVRS